MIGAGLHQTVEQVALAIALEYLAVPMDLGATSEGK
jgi:hypothetical protein